MVGSGTALDPFRPDVTGSFVMVGPERGGRCIVKQPAADGAATTNETIADLLDGDLDVTAAALSGAQRTAIRNRLDTAGIDTSEFVSDGVVDRRGLLRFLLRKWLHWRDEDVPRAIDGYDVNA